MKTTLLILLGTLLISSCNKIQINSKCCNHQPKITPAAFNQADVYIYAPQLFTPDGDGINDEFGLIGSGFHLNYWEVRKNKRLIHRSAAGERSWDGGTAKNGQYQFKAGITTIHGEVLEVKTNFCLHRRSEKEEDKNARAYCDCITADKIHPERGAIYQLGGCD